MDALTPLKQNALMKQQLKLSKDKKTDARNQVTLIPMAQKSRIADVIRASKASRIR